MRRRCRRKKEEEEAESSGVGESNDLDEGGVLDWTRLSDDLMSVVLSKLNLRERAGVESSCRTWRTLCKSPCFWEELDLRSYKVDAEVGSSLASRCSKLKKLRFRGADSVEAVVNLRARDLHEMHGESCRKILDSSLSMLVAKHEALEILHLGPDFCERISCGTIKTIAICCHFLRKLRLTGVRNIDGDAINALAKNCKNLTDIAFMDATHLDERALANISSLKFLSVAGTSHVNWDLASQYWSELPNLKGLDVSRTAITQNVVETLFSSSKSLEVLSALFCPILDQSETFVARSSRSNNRGKLLLSAGPGRDVFTDIASLFTDSVNDLGNIFLVWRELTTKGGKLEEIMNWIEWILSYALLRLTEVNCQFLEDFWLQQGAHLLLSLTKSKQEEVQERAATALAIFVITDDVDAEVDGPRVEALLQDGGIYYLLDLAKSSQEGILTEAAKALANLSLSSDIAYTIAEAGGINIVTGLTKSRNKVIAEEAAGVLWNLSVVGEEHKRSIAEKGGLNALVDLIIRWSVDGGEGVLERAAGALANLAADETCSVEIASIGGVQALVSIASNCRSTGVLEQTARALANLAAYGDGNTGNATVGQEPGALEALVQLSRSANDGVRREAAGALWNLSYNATNRQAIAESGGVEALVALTRTCLESSPSLQERAAGALWGLSVSEANSIAIGEEGGISPLVSLARSRNEEVHETAVGALWNLAFNAGNAVRIVDEGGVSALVYLCTNSVSNMGRFMASLALSYMFDGRMEELVEQESSSPHYSTRTVTIQLARKVAMRRMEGFIVSFCNTQALSAAALSSTPAALAQVAESAIIPEAGNLRCSGYEIKRFIKMLQNPYSVLKTCAAFALLQFTNPSGRHSTHHASLLRNRSYSRNLRAAAASSTAPLEAKIFARIVLRNLEHLEAGSSSKP